MCRLTASALAVKAGVEPRQVDVAQLRDALRGQGVHLGDGDAPAAGQPDGPPLQVTEEA